MVVQVAIPSLSTDMPIVIPVLATEVAELVPADAGHVIAPPAPLDHVLALPALPVVQVVLEEVDFVFLALAWVFGEHALLAEHLPALAALRVHSLRHRQHPVLALLARAQPQIRVLGRQVEGVHLLVLLAHVLGQVLRVKVGLGVHDLLAALFGTDHFLEHAHLVNHVVLQAGVAEGVRALGDLGELLEAVLALADPARECLHHLLLEHLAYPRHFHRGLLPRCIRHN